jgi:hypothetical protein
MQVCRIKSKESDRVQIQAQDALAGTWASGDQTLTFEDNTYSVDFSHSRVGFLGLTYTKQ